MYNYIKHHFFQYFIILVLFAITVTALSSPISFGLKALFIGLSIAIYFFWAIWHHWEDHNLSWKVVAEYLLLTILLFWILLNLAQ